MLAIGMDNFQFSFIIIIIIIMKSSKIQVYSSTVSHTYSAFCVHRPYPNF